MLKILQIKCEYYLYIFKKKKKNWKLVISVGKLVIALLNSKNTPNIINLPLFLKYKE